MRFEYVRVTEPSGGQLPGMDVLADWIFDRLDHKPPEPVWGRRGYNPRYVAGTRSWSAHAGGRALDIRVNAFIESEREYGDWVVKWLSDNHEIVGTQMIIWNGRVWGGTAGPVWRTFTGSNKHTDHVHFEINPTAAHGLTVEILESAFMAPSVVCTVPAVGMWDWEGRYPKWRVFDTGKVESLNGAPEPKQLSEFGVVSLDHPITSAFWDPFDGILVLESAGDGGTFALPVAMS